MVNSAHPKITELPSSGQYLHVNMVRFFFWSHIRSLKDIAKPHILATHFLCTVSNKLIISTDFFIHHEEISNYHLKAIILKLEII